MLEPRGVSNDWVKRRKEKKTENASTGKNDSKISLPPVAECDSRSLAY